jgi:hypothetical protein
MSQRASCWSVTINNPIDADEYNIASARQKGWKVEGQLEKGEQGTTHYQLFVRTPQVRFSHMKRMFPRAHIEVARNVSALQTYVNKEETRVASLKVDQAFYPTQTQIFSWYGSYYRDVKKDCPRATNLEIFDLLVAQKIRQGFYIGAECMNPQIRSYIKKFGEHIAHRELTTLDRQTDRQEKSLSPLNIIPPNNAVQEESPPVSPSSFN